MNTSPLRGPAAHRVLLPASATNRISIPFFRVQERKLLLAFIDCLLAASWLLGAYRVWWAYAHPGHDVLAQTPYGWITAGTVVWLLASWLAGAYELNRADQYRSAARTTLNVAAVTGIVALIAYFGFLKTYPRPALACVLAGVPASVMAWRALYARFLRRPASAIRLLVVGDASLCAVLTDAAAHSRAYCDVLGFVSEQPGSGSQYLGPAEDLAAVARQQRAHRIVVAPRQSLPTVLVTALSTAIEQGIEVVDFNAAYEDIAGKVAVEHAGDYWLAALPTCPRTSSLEDVGMRVLDLIGAGIGLLLTVVVGPFIALAILVESGRPIIYRQVRLGRSGQPFIIFKFRSMRADAEQAGERWAEKIDSRTTAMGRVLRRSHIDELPQFWNVLRGEMSLTGPRPERPQFTDELARTIPFYRLRLAVRPGLTGLKQIKVGYAATPDEHLEVLRHDLYYIKHRSIALNVVILARTVGSVLGLNGR